MVWLPRILALLLGFAVLAFFVAAGFNRISTGAANAPARQPIGTPSSAQSESARSAAPQAAQEDSPSEQPKRLKLAAETAEEQRIAALEQKQHAVETAPAKTKLYYKVKVRDGGTLEAGSVVIHLYGVDPHGADASCTGRGGKSWPCGAAAKFALAKFIRYRAVSCTLPGDGEQPDFVSRCSVAGTDLSTWMVRQGWADPSAGAEQTLSDAANAAKRDHAGIWRSTE